jgi:hypothetical protein
MGLGFSRKRLTPLRRTRKGSRGRLRRVREEGEGLAQGLALEGHLGPFRGEEGSGGGQGLLGGEAEEEDLLLLPRREGEVQGQDHLPTRSLAPKAERGMGTGLGF